MQILQRNLSDPSASLGMTTIQFMNAQRLFAAIDLPEILAESLVALDPHYRGLIFSAPSQIHLTLAFFAAVDPATADLLEEKLAAISFRAFFLPVTGLGTFSKQGTPHVLWIGLGHAHTHLFHLHKRLNDDAVACHFPIPDRT